MSNLLSTVELSQLRTDVQAVAFPDTCNILSVTLTPDGEGGNMTSWGTAAGTIACRLDAYRGNEAERGGEVQPFNGYVLTTAHDVTITAANRVEVGNQTFAVVAVDAGKSWAVTKRAYLELE